MSKKFRPKNHSKARNQVAWLWLTGGAAVLFMVVGLALWWGAAGTNPASSAQPGGAPRLVVDQTMVDEGYVRLDTPVRTTFRLSNAGVQPLQILGEPQVRLVEGC